MNGTNRNILCDRPSCRWQPNDDRVGTMDRYCRRGDADAVKVSRVVVAECYRSLPCLYSKVEDDVPITIHLDHVLEFRVSDSGDGVGECRRKFQREADVSLTYETGEASVAAGVRPRPSIPGGQPKISDLVPDRSFPRSDSDGGCR